MEAHLHYGKFIADMHRVCITQVYDVPYPRRVEPFRNALPDTPDSTSGKRLSTRSGVVVGTRSPYTNTVELVYFLPLDSRI